MTDTVRGHTREQWIARGARSDAEWMAADHWVNPLLAVMARTFGRYIEGTPAQRLHLVGGSEQLRYALDAEVDALGLNHRHRGAA
jgi:Ethanolamine utilization protein EutJ (predicted chaperonin)